MPEPWQRTEKTTEHEGDSDDNHSWNTWNNSNEFRSETEETGEPGKERHYQDTNTVEITEKFPEELKRFAVGQISEKANNKYWRKNLQNLQTIIMMVIPIVVGVTGMIPKGLERRPKEEHKPQHC